MRVSSLRSRPTATPELAVVGLAVAAGFAAMASWAIGENFTVEAATTSFAFGVFVLLGDLLEVPFERGGSFSLAVAPALGFALLRSCEGAGNAACSSPHLGEVAFVFLLGTTSAAVWRLARGHELRLPLTAVHIAVVLGAASVYRVVASATPSALSFGPPRMSSLGLGVVLAVVIALDVGLMSVLALGRGSASLVGLLKERARARGPLLLSTVSVGALLALAYPAFGLWTLPLFFVPLAATQFSFKQVATIRRNYVQTIGALSKVPEMAGYTVRGHSSRVAALSLDIAQDLGIVDPELHEIEYAALLHDIGRVSLPDPDDAPDSTSRLELALVGAEIVEKTGHFPRVTHMVRQQTEPYRRRGEEANRDLPLGAKIIKVASAFDDLSEPGGPSRTAWDALERLHLGMAYDYDPQVIQALTRVLERRGAI